MTNGAPSLSPWGLPSGRPSLLSHLFLLPSLIANQIAMVSLSEQSFMLPILCFNTHASSCSLGRKPASPCPWTLTDGLPGGQDPGASSLPRARPLQSAPQLQTLEDKAHVGSRSTCHPTAPSGSRRPSSEGPQARAQGCHPPRTPESQSTMPLKTWLQGFTDLGALQKKWWMRWPGQSLRR